MPLTEQDILAARSARRPPEAGILQTLFDTLFPDPALGMPAIPLMPGTLGASPASPRLGMLSRFKAARQSPLWKTMPREEQLQVIRGQPTISPDLRGALPKAGGFRSATREMSNRVGKEVPGEELLKDWNRSKLGWLKDLLEGM